MADVIDSGNETAAFFLEVARKNATPPVPVAGVGMCLNCGAAVEGDARWCDTECRSDWEHAQRRR